MSERNTDMVQDKKLSRRLRPIESVGFLLDEESLDSLVHLRKFGEDIGVEPAQMKFLVFLPKKRDLGDYEGLVLTPAGINWLGKFKSAEIREFLERSFDMLLCYQREPNRVLDKLVSSAQASLKVGRLEGSTKVFDLAIAADHKDIAIFTEEVKKYLKILNRLD